MTTRSALRQAIASGQARQVKALLDDHEALQVLKTYLQIPDDQIARSSAPPGRGGRQERRRAVSRDYLMPSNSTSKISVWYGGVAPALPRGPQPTCCGMTSPPFSPPCPSC